MNKAVFKAYRRGMEALGLFNPSRLVSAPADFLAILVYHGIEDRTEVRANHSLDISANACIEEIRFFLRQGYEAVSPGAWARPGDESKGKLLVTFDDANLNTFAFLHRLIEEEGIPVLVSVCPQVVDSGEAYWYEEIAARTALSQYWKDHGPRGPAGRALDAQQFLLDHYFAPKRPSGDLLAEVRMLTPDVSPQQVAASDHVHANMRWQHLAALVQTGVCTIAAHGMGHEAATHMTEAQFEQDVAQCRALIKSRLDIECRDYVYPFGSEGLYSEDTEAALKRVGFQRSYTTVHRLNRRHAQMALGRFTGTGLAVSPRYYHYLWRQRHASADGSTAAPL